MKKYISRTFFFLIPLFIVAAVLEISIRNLDSYYKQKISGLQQNADSIEVLILEVRMRLKESTQIILTLSPIIWHLIHKHYIST